MNLHYFYSQIGMPKAHGLLVLFVNSLTAYAAAIQSLDFAPTP
jgi:hypothetical protein